MFLFKQLTYLAELPLVVAIFLPGRCIEHLDLRIQRLLLSQRAAYLWLRQLDAVLCIQLFGLSGLRTANWHDRILDSLCICATDIWRYQSGLSEANAVQSQQFCIWIRRVRNLALPQWLRGYGIR